MPRLSKEASGLLTCFAVFFIFGLLLANPPMLLISLIPIFVYLTGLSVAVPKVEANRTGIKNSLFIGEDLQVQVKGMIKSGVGIVTIYDQIPESFRVIAGTNYKVFWKGFKDKEFSFEYKIRCPRRGTYHFNEAQWETRHFLGLKEAIYGSFGGKKELIVRSKIRYLRRIRTPPNVASMVYPKESVSKLGAISTDFKSIREYTQGDPFKFINWKATARFMAKGKNNPLMNEYEREGKRAIWIFLDAHPSLQVGTSIENAFEYCVEAANAVSYYFLDKGFRLGMYIYNIGKNFYPDTGKKQFLKIARELINLKPSIFYSRRLGESLAEAAEKTRTHLVSLSPFVIIITYVTSERIGGLLHGIKKILSYYGRFKKTSNIMVINVLPYDLIPKFNDLERSATRMLLVTNKVLCRRLRRAGVIVLNWNPRTESLGTKLMKFARFKVVA